MPGTRYDRYRSRRGAAGAAEPEHHEPVGCELTDTMPFDNMFEDMGELDELADAGNCHAARDGTRYPA